MRTDLAMEASTKPYPTELDRIARFLLPLERLSPLAPPPAVYFLLGPTEEPGRHPGEDAVLYIGKSTNLNHRLGKHAAEKAFTRVLVLPVGEQDILAAEAALIDFYAPPLNGIFGRPDQEEIARAASYLGLVNDGEPPPATAHHLPAFSAELADKLWYRLKSAARISLLFIARRRTYQLPTRSAKPRPPRDFSTQSLSHVAWVARTACRTRPPFTTHGPVFARTYKMEADIAAALKQAARKYGI
jgi:hypothetical protein